MKFTIGTIEHVQIWANGISDLTLEVTQSELSILLLAIKGRLLHCKKELIDYGIPEMNIGGTSYEKKPDMNQFNPVSFAFMSEFYLNNAEYVFGVNTFGQDFLFPVLVDFRLIEQLTKALTRLFASEEYTTDQRAKAAILCISLFEVQQHYVYRAPDIKVVPSASNGSINLQKKRAWDKARENNEL